MSSFKDEDAGSVSSAIPHKKKRHDMPATVTSGEQDRSMPEPLPLFSPRSFINPETPQRLFSPFSPGMDADEELQSAIYDELIKRIEDSPVQQSNTLDSLTNATILYKVDVEASSKLKDIFEPISDQNIFPCLNYKEGCNLRSNTKLLNETKHKMNICTKLIEKSDKIIESSTKKGLAVEFNQK